MHIDLSSQPLPKIYTRKGKDCYLDPIRKKLIFITPEETVRQQVISYLLNDLKVPIEMIGVEEHLSHYGIKSSRRADIIIKAITESDDLFPITVIECKAPNVGLDDRASQQMIDYSEMLGCDYAMMINGVQSFCYHYDPQKNEYIQISGLPKYEKMLSHEFVIYNPEPLPERISHNNISSFLKTNLDESGCDISYKTEHNLACAAFNLLECILDTRHKLPVKDYASFRLVEDYGIRMLSYGNSGGGTFFGPYRSFLIERKGSTEFVSFGFSCYSRTENPEISKTSLNVAIDNEKDSHHALQLSIDDNVIVDNDAVTFYHSGRIAIGNKGSGKVSELREFVKTNCPKIVDGTRFNLGTLVDNRNWNLDDPEITNLIENLISYALIRDEYRDYIKSKKP